MSETIKIEIEIPAPPEGWGDVKYRYITACDRGSMFWNGYGWVNCQIIQSNCFYPVARKLAPLWTPPPEWRAIFGDRWLVRSKTGALMLFDKRPSIDDEDWNTENNNFSFFHKGYMRPEVCPPEDIPWEKCCFKIGDPKE